jgi:hypothetical protein
LLVAVYKKFVSCGSQTKGATVYECKKCGKIYCEACPNGTMCCPKCKSRERSVDGKIS